jgi:Ca2+-binding EF-hand superfamily protein
MKRRKMKKRIIMAMVLAAVATGSYAALDADGDGKISKDEYIKYRLEEARKNDVKVNKDKLNQAFERADTDRDGFLSDEERQSAKKK